ncbi:hypothetical protein MRX96_044326 [Rhipicephalus microplus]
MLNNPFLCTLQVLASLFVSQFSEHGCALDPLPLPSSSVVDCRASTEAYQVACDRCEAEEFIMPVAVSSAPAPASGTDYHVVLPARINCLTSAISSSGLGGSTTGKMLNNPFLCTLQVLASLSVSQFSEHGCALDPLLLPSSSVVDCRASTEAYQVVCDRCEAEEFIMPVAVSSAPAPASGTDYHVVLPARINCLTSAIPSSGLGSSTTGKMLNNPFLCTLQVLASLFVSQFSEHGCALDPLPLPSSSVVDCRASTEAYQVACDRCEAEEFIMPVAVSSAPAPASGTDYHVVLPARINCLTSAIPSSGLGGSTTGKMLNNPFLCTLQVLASLSVSQFSEHGCALDPLLLPSSSVVDCRASTEAYQVACDRCEAEEFIMPVAPTELSPTPVEPTEVPTTSVEPTQRPTTSVEPTELPTTSDQPTELSMTSVKSTDLTTTTVEPTESMGTSTATSPPASITSTVTEATTEPVFPAQPPVTPLPVVRVFGTATNESQPLPADGVCDYTFYDGLYDTGPFDTLYSPHFSAPVEHVLSHASLHSVTEYGLSFAYRNASQVARDLEIPEKRHDSVVPTQNDSGLASRDTNLLEGIREDVSPCELRDSPKASLLLLLLQQGRVVEVMDLMSFQ